MRNAHIIYDIIFIHINYDVNQLLNVHNGSPPQKQLPATFFNLRISTTLALNAYLNRNTITMQAASNHKQKSSTPVWDNPKKTQQIYYVMVTMVPVEYFYAP